MNAESETQLPILIVEDDIPTAELEAKVLARSGRVSRIAHCADEALAALRTGRFSSILLDYLLVNESGWSVLEFARRMSPPVPVIVVTGKGNEKVAAEALRLGAADYVIKDGDYWEVLPNIVDRTERTAQAQLLRQSLAAAAEAADDAIIGTAPEGGVETWNPAAGRIFGYSGAEIRGRPIADLFPAESRGTVQRHFEKAAKGEPGGNFDTTARRKDNTAFFVSVAVSTVRNAEGQPAGVSMVIRDISDRRRAEEQLRRTEYQLRLLQKYEAIRQIAGGVAHEFNNLLTVIIVRSELIRGSLEPNHPIQPEIDQVIKAGERAATVTRQLLAFSRQQFMRPKVINLNVMLTEIQPVLKRLLGDNIKVEACLAPDLALTRADPVKLNEVIVNLALNAKDAMPGGGRLNFETANETFDHDSARAHQGLIPGRYASLVVADTGSGMDSATLAHIFEPFFTTKGRASRNGLGLAMVYGTVKQSEGYIYASSEPGQGSRFEIFLPVAESVERGAAVQATEVPNRTVLIVEDEQHVLEIVSEILSGEGYTLLTATSPKEALLLAERYKSPIEMLLTDVIMPEMNGPELAIRLTATHPKIRVLYMSGFPENDSRICGSAKTEFIAKPFSIEGLKRKVQDLMSGAPHPGS